MPKRKVLFVREIVKQILQIVICYKLQKSSGQKRQKRPQQRCETCTETSGPLMEAFLPEDHLRPQERKISHIYTKRDGRFDGTENLCAKPCVALIKTSWLCNFLGFVCMFLSWERGWGWGICLLYLSNASYDNKVLFTPILFSLVNKAYSLYALQINGIY